MQLNAGAFRVVEEILAQPDALGVSCHRSASGTRIVDCGVKSAGSIEAGILVARAALAGLGTVRIESPGPTPRPYDAAWPGCSWPIVAVESDQPLAACLASQYAGWKVSTNGYFAMASGPIRAAIGREDLFDSIGMRERADVAIGLLETAKLPPDEVCLSLAADAKVDADKLIVLVARTASTAGTLQVIARSLETALHKLHDLRFDLRRIRRGSGWAPLAPVPLKDDLAAIGRTNDAILYGGRVELFVSTRPGQEGLIDELGPKTTSSASPAHGQPFAEIFKAAGGDFYKIDPRLFAPAELVLHDLTTGRSRVFGETRTDLLRRSFGA